jgi:hypothetical protein
MSQPALGSSTLVIVATTVVVAALFEPLRRRLQSAIDRRFYRGTYDAERTLREFGATLRSVTHLDHLQARLFTVIKETMHPEHPEHVSLIVAPRNTLVTLS